MRKETKPDTFNNQYDVELPSRGSYMIKTGGRMEKTAYQDTHIPDKLQACIERIKSGPKENMTYLYDRALGAGEIYGANNNGDWFGEDWLKRCHSTFEDRGDVYRHHQNDDPSNSVGDILASAFNKPLSTVDLILRIPTSKIQDEINKLEEGGTVATSMGCNVDYDVCSICGNKASSRSKYCHHLRNRMGDILDDGREVFAKNPDPTFKDISFVVVRAAPESVVLKKVAEDRDGHLSTSKFERTFGDNANKEGMMVEASVDALNHLDRADAVKTAHKAYGPLRPDEFKALIEKDASYLRPDHIPCVTMRQTEGPSKISGEANDKIAFMLKNTGVHQKEGREKKEANFLSKTEKEAYIKYRKEYTPNDRRYLR